MPDTEPRASHRAPAPAADDDAARSPGRGFRQPAPIAAAICVLGLLMTGLATWAAAGVDRDTEERLLATQSQQAATVLATAIQGIQQPLAAVLEVQPLVGPEAGTTAFEEFFADQVGPEQTYVNVALWQRDGPSVVERAMLGEPTGLDLAGPEGQSLLQRSLAKPGFLVKRVEVGEQTRIAYVLADPETGFVVYAERAIPADRRAPVDRDSAFVNLDYAIYLGPAKTDEALTTTNVGADALPLDGLTYEASVPFGDTVLTLVTSPAHHLGSRLSQRLPWLLLVGGVLLTAAVALVALGLVRSRQRAMRDTDTITRLYERVDSLYGEQRNLFVRLQRALLPQVIPDVAGVEVAAEYVAGAEGIDIGGDWYSLIARGEDEFAFVVGDVSGRGVDAVAEMARARFTLRAYLFDGDSPEAALAKCSRQFDVSTDGHIVTALVGVANRTTGEVAVANAGHPLPLLVSDDDAEFVTMPVGAPLGVGRHNYEPATFSVPLGSTMLAYTDGLVERRGEDIDTGMERLRRTALRVGPRPLDVVIAEVLASAQRTGTTDDVAILAVRRTAR